MRVHDNMGILISMCVCLLYRKIFLFLGDPLFEVTVGLFHPIHRFHPQDLMEVDLPLN